MNATSYGMNGRCSKRGVGAGDPTRAGTGDVSQDEMSLSEVHEVGSSGGLLEM